MKLQVLTDQNGYVITYGIVHYITDEVGNTYCPFVLNNSIEVDLDDDISAFEILYEAYYVEDGILKYDNVKAEEIYNNNAIKPPTEAERIFDELINKANDIINE